MDWSDIRERIEKKYDKAKSNSHRSIDRDWDALAAIAQELEEKEPQCSGSEDKYTVNFLIGKAHYHTV